MTKEELTKFIDDKESGIILFHSEGCKICDMQKTLYSKAIPNSYNEVRCDLDPEWFIQNHSIDLIPVTRIYENGKIVWEKINLPEPHDVEMLIEYVAAQ
jgi:hypothetical protein